MHKPAIEVGDVFRAFQHAFQKRYGNVMLPSHRRAISDVTACMTEEMGGHRHRCNDCDTSFWAYHGCRNRSCPKCHGRQIVTWLKKRSVELLPTQYFHVVATTPAELRPLFLAHQKDMYGLLMKVTAQALIDLARERRYLGATPGILAVLHTWSSTLQYHPHVHMLVTGGGLESDDATWREVHASFLVPVKKLSPLIRKRFKEELQKKHPELFKQVVQAAWKKEWCSFADSKPVGVNQNALLTYLARYVFRIAITSARILHMDKTHVTFKYKENRTGEWKTQCIPGVEFMRRFLLHVLPKGFHKVRYFGLWSPGRKTRLRLLVNELQLQTKQAPLGTMADLADEALRRSELESHDYVPKCPHCGSTNVTHLQQLRRRWRRYVM